MKCNTSIATHCDPNVPGPGRDRAASPAAVSLPWVAYPDLGWPLGRRPCWGTLWQLGRAAEMYANDHDGEPPPDVGALVGTYFDGRIKPGHFIYVNGLRPYDRGDCVLAFCRPGSHGPDGGSVLFLDGHVEQVAEPRLRELLDRTREAAKYHGRTVELVELGPAAE